MNRTPRPARRAVAALAAVSSAAALAVVAGAAPTASAEAVDYTVCDAADTKFFLSNVGGEIEMSARYWNGSRTEPVVVLDPSTIKVVVHKSSRRVTVTAVEGLIPLGGIKHVANPDTGLGADSNIAWTGTIKLRMPPPGTGYTLCGDDPSRESVPWS